MKKFTRWVLALGLCLALLVCGALAAETPAVKVQLDGQDLAFTDAVPQVKDQRTFLPFRAVFEAMGAEVDYEGSVITAVRSGKTLTMTLGQTAATVTEGGKTIPITMDVAPYVDPATWRTYVPVRFAAQAFGCSVGWDQAAQTAIIIDLDKLMDQALEGKSFTYLEKLSALEKKYETGIWDATGTFDLDLSVMGMPMKVNGTLSGTTQDSEKMSMDMTMKMDMSQFISQLVALGGETPSAEDQAMLDTLKTDGVRLAMRGDMAQGQLYMNMDMGALGEKSGFDANTWYKMDMAALLEQAGMSWPELMDLSKNTDSISLVKTVLSMVEPDDAANDYTDLKTAVEGTANKLCDEAFAPVDGQRVTSYTLDEDGMNLDLSLALDMNGEAVKGYTMDMDFTAQVEGQPVTMSMTVSLDDQGKTTAKMVMGMGSLLSMDMTIDGADTPGTTAPVTTPPEGATVVDYMEMLQAQMGANVGVIGGADGPTSIQVG